MSRSALELQVLREQTIAFIEGDPTDIVVERRPRVSNGAGGWRFSGPVAVLPAQQVHIVAAGGEVTARETADGRKTIPSHRIVARHDADLALYDLFSYNGRTYQVLWVSADLEYVTHAEAAPQ